MEITQPGHLIWNVPLIDMEKEELEDFSKFAHEYKSLVDKGLKFGGEKGEYYSEYKAKWMKRYLGEDFSGKILDYGCGIGVLSDVLLKYFPHAAIDGFDVSAASIEYVPAHLKAQGCFTPEMKDLGQTYDVIVIANVLHHVEKNEREGVIAQIRKKVRKDGKVFIFEHNPYNPLTCKIVKDSPLDRGVVLLPSFETLRYLKKAGFKGTGLKYIVFFPKIMSALRWAEPFLSWFPLGAQYAVVAFGWEVV